MCSLWKRDRKKHRENGSAYLDLEAQITRQLQLDGAIRGETYSDFGQVLTGKLSARYDFTHAFALRGTVSTGFRAPSLQQEYFTSIASVITNGQPILTGTFPATAPVSAALGGLEIFTHRNTLAFGSRRRCVASHARTRQIGPRRTV